MNQKLSLNSGRQKRGRKYGYLTILVGIVGLFLWTALFQFETEESRLKNRIQKNLEQRQQISKAITTSVRRNEWPEKMEFSLNGNTEEYSLNYTLDPRLQNEAEQLLKRYRPDFGAVVMMEASTGRILSLVSYERNPELKTNLALRATYPAASVFKIITSAAAIDKAGLSPTSTIHFNGSNYTLYRKNVMSDRINRWTRKITLKDAFAHSINTAFGRLSLEKLNPEDLMNYAHRFMFNQEIPVDFNVEMGLTVVPAEKNYELTQVASGFNRLTRMSPIQGAMIAASIVNEGKMVIPYLVDSVSSPEGDVVYKGETLERGQILSTESAHQLRELMTQTVLRGTSRGSFRSLVKDRRFQEIRMGGKTGHLTGDNPKGRVDWFVGYASDIEDRKVAVAAITINKDFWTVKSSYLAQSMFKKYFEPSVKRKVARVPSRVTISENAN